MEILDLPAYRLAQSIRERSVSCREVMQATLARIDVVNPTYNAIVSLREPDTLLREADTRDAELHERGANGVGFLHGIPQAIKDAVPTADIRTTFGSPLLRDNVPADDALMVQ